MKRARIKRVYLIVIFSLVCLALPVRAGHKWPFLSNAMAEKETYTLSESKLFPKTLQYIERYYVEPERIDPKEMFKGALDDVQKLVPEILILFNSPTSITATIDKSQKKFSSSLKNLDDLWKIMSEIVPDPEQNGINYNLHPSFRRSKRIAIKRELNLEQIVLPEAA